MEVKDYYVLVHAIPLTGEDLGPKLLWQPNKKGKWSIEVVDGYIWREVSDQLTWPIQRKQQRQQSLHDDRIHADVVVHQHNLALVDDADENLHEELWLDPHEEIVEIKVLKFEAFEG